MTRKLRWLASSIAVLAMPLMFVAGSSSEVAGASSAVGYLRIGHFVPGTGAISVSVDGRAVANAVTFQQVTSYFAVPAGTHTVKVVVPNAPTSADAPSMAVTVGSGRSMTVLVTAKASGAVALTAFPDDLAEPPAGHAKVRVIDTLASVPALAGTLNPVPAPTDPPPFQLPPTPVGMASPYLAVPASSYNVQFINATNGTTVLSGNDWPVAAGTVASLVVLRGASAPTLEVLKDAIGATAMPSGGMATGAGGMAERSQWRPGALAFGLGLLLMLAIGGGVLLGWGRRPVGTAALACATKPAGCGSRAPALTSSRGVLASSPGVLASSPGVTGSGTPAMSSRSADPGAAAIPAPSMPPSVDLSGAGTADAGPPPVRISIPSIGVNAAVVDLGRNSDGTMQVPTDFNVAGWYDQGPAPGALGPAVIVGHIDNDKGPAVFWRLGDMRPGDRVVVTSAKGPETFEVNRIESVAKTAFPTAEVFGPVPDAELRLITCGGPFDRSSGHYVDNTVVFATLVSA